MCDVVGALHHFGLPTACTHASTIDWVVACDTVTGMLVAKTG